MAKLPWPPPAEDLRARVAPELATLEAGTALWRLYFRAGAHPTTWDRFRAWGPADARFDPHQEPPRAQDRGVLYAAREGPTCLAEVFQTTRVVDRRSGEPWLVAFRLARPAALLDLTGAFATRLGASMALASGRRDVARAWARAMYAAWPRADGVLYGSSMDANRPAVALWERAADALPAHPALHRPLDDPGLLPFVRGACRRFGYELV